MDESTIHQMLLHPDTYPEKTGPVSFCETHISRLYFTDSHVYKIKKAVNLGFLDFTTLEKRLYFCREEIRLNRRFCSDTYMGVLPLRTDGRNLHLGGTTGTIIDYAVQMKRLPQERMLDVLIARDDPLLPEEMERLASFLAAAHQQAPPASEVAPTFCNWTSIQDNWRENFSQTEPFAGRTIPGSGLRACREQLETIMREQRPLFVRREKEGFVREVHGDLHAEHICLTRPVKIYDCIEFNQRFRISDILSDLAFLLMDLEFRGRRDLAGQVLDSYLARSNPQDGQEILLPFYKIYRAWVRGKVESIAMSQHQPAEDAYQAAQERACRYFNLAMGYLCPPFVLITCGLMGSGKSVIARRLAQVTGASLIRSDVLRKQLMGLAPQSRAEVSFEKGIYRPEISEVVYDRLAERAAKELKKGNSVIADASFARAKHRQTMAQTAKECGVDFWLAQVECAEPLLKERLARRERQHKDVSDGRLSILDNQAAKFDEVNATPATIKVDTALALEYNIGLILNRMLIGNKGRE